MLGSVIGEKEQEFHSATTSVNSAKLPIIYKKINWDAFPPFFTVLDYGAGKYLRHIAEFIKQKGGIYYGYDKYNQTPEYNQKCLACNPDVILISNVYNVIKEDDIVLEIHNLIRSFNMPFFTTIYEGNGTNIGKGTKKGCYQRNQKTNMYLFSPDEICYHKIITIPEYKKFII